MKKKVQEKLELARKNVKTSEVNKKAELRAKVQEKLETARKKKEIQERIKNLRNK